MEASTSGQAQARWELENKVQHDNDQLLKFDEAEHQAVQAEAPWKKDPRHYTKCAAARHSVTMQLQQRETDLPCCLQ